MKNSKKDSFESLYKEIEDAVEKIENDKLPLSESMKMYEDTVTKIQNVKKILEKMEGRVKSISKNNS